MADTQTFVIRKARPSDAPSISQLLHELGYLKYINEETEPQTETRVREGIAILSASSEHVLLVAMYEGSDVVLGYGSVHFYANMLIGNEGYISELYFRTSATNQGIGGKLLATLEDEARSRNVRRLRLANWRIRESYQRGFYAKHGWQENPDAAEFVRVFY